MSYLYCTDSQRVGDVIVLLHRDTANWWMGQHQQSGQQGFFPSNYVAEDVRPGNYRLLT